MSNNRNGLGIEKSSGSLISPCPSMINSFFVRQLKYNKVDIENKKNNNQYLVRYVKTLNQADNPLFPELTNITCVSNIIVDMYDGSIVDHYFKVNKGPAIRNYQECPSLEPLQSVFKWHINIVHASREYIKGGWMSRNKVKEEIEDSKKLYKYLSKTNFTNILKYTKDELNIEKGD